MAVALPTVEGRIRAGRREIVPESGGYAWVEFDLDALRHHLHAPPSARICGATFDSQAGVVKLLFFSPEVPVGMHRSEPMIRHRPEEYVWEWRLDEGTRYEHP